MNAEFLNEEIEKIRTPDETLSGELLKLKRTVKCKPKQNLMSTKLKVT